MLVQALVPELAVEALDVGVLGGLAGGVQQMADASGSCPGQEGPAGELRPLVGAHSLGATPEACSLLQQPNPIPTAHAKVHGQLNTFVAEVVCHRQALDAPAVGKAVRDEIHAPDLIDPAGGGQRNGFHRQATFAAPLADRQARRLIQAVDTLVVVLCTLDAQQIHHPPVAEAPTLVGDGDDGVLKFLVAFAHRRRIPVGVSRQPRKAAGTAFGEVTGHHHPFCRLPACLRG